MTGLLAEMARSSHARAADTLRRRGLDAVRHAALARAAPPALRLGDFDLIAEIKLVAPSAGVLAQPAESERAGLLTRQATAYAGAGVAAISVLTEPDRFGGRLEDLARVSDAVPTPTMRKDFLVHPVQVWEAREAGASGVLLIVRMLDDADLDALADAAAEAGLFVLAEAFDADDLRRCGPLAARWTGAAPLLVGVNVRDLVTLRIDPVRLRQLVAALPAGVPAVAESGMEGPADCAHAATLGYRLALVGSALMRASDPAALAVAMRAAGRAARSGG